MATAKKLKSGSWRIRVYSHKDADGKEHYKSFTCDDPSPKGKRKCEKMAADWAIKREQFMAENRDLTFEKALEDYISERSKILSPASIRKYKGLQRNHFSEIKKIPIIELTQGDIQRMINGMSDKYSPKTTRDVHGLITAILKRNGISLSLNTAMPKKTRTEVYVPTDDEVKKLIASVKDTDMELPILLGAFAALRRGEISALEASDLDGNMLHVHQTMVYTDDNEWIIKAPKSYAGDRYVSLPRYVVDKFPKKGQVTTLTPNKITSRFEHCLKQAGLPHFRFHDLRHYNASIKHALGIPDAVIMQENGWGNDKVMKDVYRHVMRDRNYDSVSANYFDDMTRNMTR